MNCKIAGCEKAAIGRGWCRMHYSRWWRCGDPTKIRRTLASTGECQREGCTNSIKIGPAAQRNRKFCSNACYYASGITREFKPRPCRHCEAEYVPSTPNQRFCLTCLGPVVGMGKNGSLIYAGMRRLRVYGVSHPEWQQMLARFSGRCWICRAEDATDLDHCHKTERPRGALCSRCNNRMQTLDRERWFTAAQSYLAEVGEPY